jgi:hypothetical protein
MVREEEWEGVLRLLRARWNHIDGLLLCFQWLKHEMSGEKKRATEAGHRVDRQIRFFRTVPGVDGSSLPFRHINEE